MTLRLLTAYLFQFHRLPLPDMGTIVLRKQSAQLNPLEKKINPPTYILELNSSEIEIGELTEWLAMHLHTTSDEAFYTLKNYVQKIKDHLTHTDTFNWGALGLIGKTESGQFTFTGNELISQGHKTLQAEKVIRTNPEHEVLIGDRTYAGENLAQLLKSSKKEKMKSRDYLPALGIIFFLLIIMYLFISDKYMFERHQQQFKLNVKTPPDTYIILSSDE